MANSELALKKQVDEYAKSKIEALKNNGSNTFQVVMPDNLSPQFTAFNHCKIKNDFRHDSPLVPPML